jgi:hypothetical protein
MLVTKLIPLGIHRTLRQQNFIFNFRVKRKFKYLIKLSFETKRLPLLNFVIAYTFYAVKYLLDKIELRFISHVRKYRNVIHNRYRYQKYCLLPEKLNGPLGGSSKTG